MRKLSILCAVLVLPALAAAAARTSADSPGLGSSSATLTCDTLDYQAAGGLVTAEGHAVLVSSNTRLKADRMFIDMDRRTVRAEGRVSMEDGAVTILANGVEFSSDSSSGTFTDGYFEDPPYRLWARRIVRVSSEMYHMERAAITSCELNPPHYHVRAKALDYVPGKSAAAHWPVVALGDDPVFAWPYYRKYFRKKPWTFTIDPGRSSYQGLYAKSILTYRVTESAAARLYWDHFQRTGEGLGAEYNYHADDVRGSLYGYRIVDRVTHTSRWNGRLAHWQQLRPRLSLELSALAQSDNQFNNNYFRDDLFRVYNQALSNAALTYQRDASVSRVSVEHDRAFDPVRRSFVEQKTVLPELSFLGAPWRFGRSSYLTLSGAARREYDRPSAAPPAVNPIIAAQDRYKGTGEGALGLQRVFALGRKMTFQPTAGLSGSWTSWQSTGTERDPHDLVQGRISAGASVRTRLTAFWDADLDYVYRVRWAPGQVKRQHADPGDQGLEADTLMLSSYYRRPTVWGKLSSGYDLRDRKDESLFSPRRKAVPPALDLGWTPSRRTAFNFREVYSLFPGRHSQGTWFSWRTAYSPDFQFSSGFSYNGALPGELGVRHGATFLITRGWKMEGAVRYLLRGPGGVRFDAMPRDRIEQEYVLRRDLHCWAARVTWRTRPGFHEFYIRVELKGHAVDRQALASPDESQYYPGRDKE